jgi:hypothetical protein
VALARALHGRGLTAVACGFATAGDGLGVLAAWADVIFLLTPDAQGHVPAEHRGKVVLLDVGPDRWVNPYHQELAGILNARLDRYFAGEANP